MEKNSIKEISTKEQLDNLLLNRTSKTQTWKVATALLNDLPSPDLSGMRRMTPNEEEELTNYLGINKGELKGPFYVGELVCPNCSRSLHFLDFVKTAVDAGIHPVRVMADILSGKNGIWITIAGTNEVRAVNCASCLAPFRFSEHKYSSKDYRYC